MSAGLLCRWTISPHDDDGNGDKDDDDDDDDFDFWNDDQLKHTFFFSIVKTVK